MTKKRGRPPKKTEPEMLEKDQNESKIDQIEPKNEQKPENQVQDDPRLPNKSLFRIDETADYFGVSTRCIDLWITHGHLVAEKIVGSKRISRESILRCRFRKY